MAQINLNLEAEDSKIIFDDLVKSLTDEQKIEAFTNFLVKTYSSDKDYWSKGYFQKKIDDAVYTISSSFIKEKFESDIKPLLESNLDLYNYDKWQLVFKDAINNSISNLIYQFISTSILNYSSNMQFNIEQSIKQQLQDKGIILF